jgi:hypothetical protein
VHPYLRGGVQDCHPWSLPYGEAVIEPPWIIRFNEEGLARTVTRQRPMILPTYVSIAFWSRAATGTYRHGRSPDSLGVRTACSSITLQIGSESLMKHPRRCKIRAGLPRSHSAGFRRPRYRPAGCGSARTTPHQEQRPRRIPVQRSLRCPHCGQQWACQTVLDVNEKLETFVGFHSYYLILPHYSTRGDVRPTSAKPAD